VLAGHGIADPRDHVCDWICHYCSLSLPAALRHAGDVTFERQLAEAQPAHIELAHVRAGPTAQLAAVAVANLVFQRLLFFGDLRSRCHLLILEGLWAQA